MKKSILLACLSGLLLWLAWPPMPYTAFLLFVAFVPMLLGLENLMQSGLPQKGKKIFWTAFLGFFIWNTLSIYWVYNSIKAVGALVALSISMVPYSLGPLLMAAVCWLYYRLRQVAHPGLSLAGFVLLWIGYEYLHQCWDLNFPWMTLGNGFASSYQWVQWYSYTGVYGGTLWVLLANALAFLLFNLLTKPGSVKSRLQMGAVLVLVILVPIVLSLYQYQNFKADANPANVVVVQPNIDPYAKNGDMPAAEQISVLTRLSDSVGQRNTEFFIWPETAINGDMPANEETIRTNPYYLQVQRFLNKYKNGNVLTGIESYKQFASNPAKADDGTPAYEVYNAAVNIENSAEVQFYHKSKLVPGVEQMPFGDALSFLKPVFAHLGGATGSYGKQKEPSVFYSQAGMGVAPVICYESIYGGYVAQYVRKGAQFIAVITNDGWWENTSGKDQHLLYARLRAIETRRWVCRSANTGISAFINERGDMVKQSAWWQRTALKQDINLGTDLTFYVLHTDYIPHAASALAILLIVYIAFAHYQKRGKKAVA